MGCRLVRNAIAATLALCCAAALAQPKPPKIIENNGDIKFRAVLDRVQDTTQPKIGGGAELDTRDWPATVEAKSDLIPCTGTLIGAEVLLTAAHCVGHGKRATITFDNGDTVNGECRRHPDYSLSSNPSLDWALCRMEKVDRWGLYFERLNLASAGIKKNSSVTLAGYGCVNLKKPDKVDGKLRGGTAAIQSVPQPQAQWPHWFTTVKATDANGIFACPGDSGGAVYIVRANGMRQVVAVTSAVGADESDPDTYRVSYLATASSGALAAFLKEWQVKDQPMDPSTNQPKPKPHVCGVDPEAVKCRPAN